MIISIASNGYEDIEPICKALALRYGLKYENIESTATKEEGYFNTPRKDTIYKGPLAVWKMKDPDVRIFLKASAENKVRYLVTNKKLGIEDAKKEIENEDNESREFFVNNFGINIKDYGVCDLVINIDKINQDGIIGVIEKYLNKMKK
jgi:cytidylate kinase